MRFLFILSIAKFLLVSTLLAQSPDGLLLFGSYITNKDSVLALKIAEDTTVLVTLPKPNPLKDLKASDDLSFILGSCAFRGSHRRDKIFESMAITAKKEAARFMLWLGDAVYLPDKIRKKPKRMWKWNKKNKLEKRIYACYYKHFSRPLRTKFTVMLPNYACADDHDLGCNNTHAVYGGIHQVSSRIFKHYFPNEGYTNDKLYYSFQAGDCDFFILDVRSNAIMNSTWLGIEQVEWLREQLEKSQNDPSVNFRFIVTGIPFLRTEIHNNKFADCPEERNALLHFIHDAQIPGIIFISGDIHYTEINKLGRHTSGHIPDPLRPSYPLYEFTISAMTSLRNSLKSTKNDMRFDEVKMAAKGKQTSLYKRNNYGLIRIHGTDKDRSCTLSVFNRKGQELWRYSLKAGELK